MRRIVYIKADCPHCRTQVNMPNGEYRLWVCLERDRNDYYTFTCTACGQPAMRSAVGIQKILTENGVPVEVWKWPAEMDDPARTAEGVLSNNDVLDFLLELGKWDGVEA